MYRYDMLSDLTTDYLDVSKMPSFISANPEKTIEYLEYFEANFKNAVDQIRHFSHGDKSEISRLVRTLDNYKWKKAVSKVELPPKS